MQSTRLPVSSMSSRCVLDDLYSLKRRGGLEEKRHHPYTGSRLKTLATLFVIVEENYVWNAVLMWNTIILGK